MQLRILCDEKLLTALVLLSKLFCAGVSFVEAVDSFISYNTTLHHSTSQIVTVAQGSSILDSIIHHSMDTLGLGRIDAEDVVEPQQECFFSIRVCQQLEYCSINFIQVIFLLDSLPLPNNEVVVD